MLQQFEVGVGGGPAALEPQRLGRRSELPKVPREGDFIERLEVDIVHVQGPHVPE